MIGSNGLRRQRRANCPSRLWHRVTSHQNPATASAKKIHLLITDRTTAQGALMDIARTCWRVAFQTKTEHHATNEKSSSPAIIQRQRSNQMPPGLVLPNSRSSS